MLRGYVSTSPTGRSIALGEVDIERKTKKGFYTEYTGSTPTGNSMIEPNANYVHIPYNETASRAFLGYNVYLDGAFAAFTTDLFYQYTGLVDGTTYLSEVTALYDEGESIPVDYTFTFGTVVALPLPYGATFDTELPADWTNVVNAGTGVWEWYGAGTHVPVNSDGNYVGADADINPGQEWDVSLFTPSIDMSGQTLVTVEFDKNFQDFAGNGEGHAWIYSGGVYQEEIGYWDVDDPTGGEHILYQLNPSAYPDPANVQVEFWYAATSSTGWYFSLDNVDIYGDAAAAPAVFFSEYIEGSSNNKAMEIYNGSGADINLDDFRINQSVNGGGWEFQHIFPAGAILADGDVWVILNDATDPGLFDPAGADEILGYPSVVHHNGDDARGLEYSDDGGATWTLIDIIGDPDVDPGDGWDVAGVTTATQNHTLVRKDVILTGNVDWALSAGTTAGDSEWEVYDIDTFDYLGAHPGMPGGAVIVVTPMSINETLQPDDVVVVPVTIENTGSSDLTFDITVVETTTDAIIPTTRHSAPNTDLSLSERDPNMVEMNHTNNSDVLFDLQFSYPAGVGGGEAGFETDGNFLYTTKWNGDVFYRYALDGTYIEEFTVAGAAGVRDLAYDG
ncbi:MAG: lamin tail domain-containing protein, partial [Candidatus Cloacimonetes bacterium]|nr:lamin tail domain-containing protein [Candidatus Cloacimonadota bacterium]